MCSQKLMHAISHAGCVNTVGKKSALKVEKSPYSHIGYSYTFKAQRQFPSQKQKKKKKKKEEEEEDEDLKV